MTKETTLTNGHYELIALDMDGTLLNSQKEVDPVALLEIKRASERGKLVALSTGRCLDELTIYPELLEHIHYGILESGAVLYDFKNRKFLKLVPIQPDYLKNILDSIDIDNIMIQAMRSGESHIREKDFGRFELFHMAQFESLFETTAQKNADMEGYMLEHKGEFTKLNLYHSSPESRQQTLDQINQLPLEFVNNEITLLEISQGGVSKGSGLVDLCEILNIPISQTIAVGDSTNDIAILKTCGLPIAMGNSAQDIKDLCTYVVADNDHHGVGEAIKTYFCS